MMEASEPIKKEILFDFPQYPLGIREAYRDEYWKKKDPICKDRLWWRAQTFRHLVHLLPHQNILELGCGAGLFTEQLIKVSRGENPITALTFIEENTRPTHFTDQVEFFNVFRQTHALAGKQFDFIVAMDLLDSKNCAWLLQKIYDLLKPGGQVIFYESNPWNVMLKIRGFLGKRDPRNLLSRRKLYELISEIGFIRVFAVYNDFVFAPLTPRIIWVLRNLSIILENTSGIQTLAGSILLRVQKPPRQVEYPITSLADHPQLKGSVSVVIPCHNEEMNIPVLIERLKGFYGEYLYEIIPVDDNSTDSTGAILRKMSAEDPLIRPVFRKPPNGVGRAIKDGIDASQGAYVLTMDCDFQHLLPELRDLFDAIAQGYDVAVGSRFSRHSVLLNYPVQKIIANRGFHSIAQILLRRKFRDLTNNLKLMRREVVDRLDLTQPGFSVNAETGLQPLLMGFKLKEVPISWINRTPDMGVSSFKLMKVGGGYWEVLKQLWWKKRAGGFKNK